jgi:hypothetical protein
MSDVISIEAEKLLKRNPSAPFVTLPAAVYEKQSLSTFLSLEEKA